MAIGADVLSTNNRRYHYMWPFNTDTKAEQHQKGKEDADRGEYDPPSGLSDVSGFNRLGDTCGFEEKNKAYEEGRSKGGK